VIHYWWQVKPGVLAPLGITVILAVLLAARPVLDWVQDRKMRAAYSRT
jgi:sulfoxide reductase heme-binding subunit YedZ